MCERVLIIDRGRIDADGTPEDLRRRMVGAPALEVELKGVDGDAASRLGAMPGVTSATERGSGRFLIEHTAEADPREAVFRLAVDQGWVLMEMSPRQASLEDVFVRLTTRDLIQAGEPAVAVDTPAGEEV